jgi:N-acetyl-anhydromuramyl-L-alanine amidase AmpD
MKASKGKYDKAAFLDSIKLEKFDTNQYYADETAKRQLYFHFTVSGYGSKGDIDWWRKDPRKVAAHMIVDYDGVPHQLYSTRFWGHHLGINEKTFLKFLPGEKLVRNAKGQIINNSLLNQSSIAIEIDTWGPLLESDKRFYPVRFNAKTNKWVPDYRVAPIPKKNVLELQVPYRGFKFYERFSDAQIDKCREICYYVNEKYNIPLKYNENMFDVNVDALSGEPGIWSHSSVRADKFDIMPQPKFIDMLKSL